MLVKKFATIILFGEEEEDIKCSRKLVQEKERGIISCHEKIWGAVGLFAVTGWRKEKQ